MAVHRNSDRWVTPGVVVCTLVLATVVILSVVASVTYLTARGLDPDPMLRLTAQVGGAVFSAGTFALQLLGRRTVTKVERNFGQLAPVVAETLDALDEERARLASQRAQETPERAPAPNYPPTGPMPFYEKLRAGNGGGPAPGGS